MSLPARNSERGATASPLALLWGSLVAAFGLGLYLWTLAPGVFWLDSNELVAAAHTLSPAHPPGHPLYIVLAKLVSLLPVGSVAARVNLFSALLGVAALVALYGLTLRALRREDRDDERWTAPCAALASVVLAASPALWFQSVRAEVYTLNLTLTLVPLWLLSRRTARAGHVLVAAFVVGLGLANHHYLVALAGPGILWLMLSHAEGRRAFRPRRLPMLLAAGLAGLLPYALLPLWSRPDAAIVWGETTSLGGFLDYVTARVFQSSVGASVRAGLLDNIVTATTLFMEQLGPAVTLAGIVGLYLVGRRRPHLGGALALVLVGSVMSKALMFLDPANPDDHGYFSPALAMLALGAGVTAGHATRALISVLRGRGLRTLAAAALGAVLVTAGVSRIASHHDACDLQGLRGPDVVLQATLEAVPPAALVMPYYYTFQFQLWYGQLVEERRPDVAIINQTFLPHLAGGRPYLDWIRHNLPDWADLADAYETEQAFPTEATLRRAAAHPIYIEPFTTLVVPPEHLDPRGLLARVVAAAPSADEEGKRQAWRTRFWRTLLRRLGPEPWRIRHTRMFLTWYAYLEAALDLRRGFPDSARRAACVGLGMNPRARELRKLGEGKPTTAHDDGR